MKNQNLIDYILQLADSNLILAQRNAECCAHGPILEQDIAITNISLDLLGQARNFYQYAATLTGGAATEDTLAYLRSEREYKNLLITELPNGDWGRVILRQFFYSVYQHLLYTSLTQSSDTQLAAIAVKSVKETTYHLKWSSEWVIRLGDGTEESHQRIQNAISFLWEYCGECFIPSLAEIEMAKQGIGTDVESLQQPWLEKIKEVFDEATLEVPDWGFMQSGGKTGMHTEYLGFMLAEMQMLQRTHPGATW